MSVLSEYRIQQSLARFRCLLAYVDHLPAFSELLRDLFRLAPVSKHHPAAIFLHDRHPIAPLLEEEILALAKAEGVTLTDEQLEAVSGGACIECIIKCPKCGSGNWDDEYKEINHIKYRKFKCNDCGHKWKEETY